MTIEHPTHKRSLGALRKATKTKERSPELLGQMQLQRHTFAAIAEAFKETDASEATCNLAGWKNVDKDGTPYLTVEISPRFAQRKEEAKKSDLLDFI
jgi:phosphoenolpyruvate carboxylase